LIKIILLFKLYNLAI